MWSVCYSPILLMELQNGTAVLLQLLIMLNTLLYHTAILPLSINPREGKTYTCIKICTQTSLAVQWLKLHASTAGGTGSTPGQETKILHALQCSSAPHKRGGGYKVKPQLQTTMSAQRPLHNGRFSLSYSENISNPENVGKALRGSPAVLRKRGEGDTHIFRVAEPHPRPCQHPHQ